MSTRQEIEESVGSMDIDELAGLSRQNIMDIQSVLTPALFGYFLFYKNIRLYGGINEYIESFLDESVRQNPITHALAHNGDRSGIISLLHKMRDDANINEENRMHVNNALSRLSHRHEGKQARKSSGYKISASTRAKAKRMGVDVRPSTRKGKKIDVFRHGKKVASIGALGYNDFTTYSRKSKSKASERRRLYHIRHKKDEARKGSPGYYAAKLLW